MFDIANVDETVGSMGTSQEVTSCTITATSENETAEPQMVWQEHTAGRTTLEDSSGTKEVEEEAVWMEVNLKEVVNNHAKRLRVTVNFKQ